MWRDVSLDLDRALGNVRENSHWMAVDSTVDKNKSDSCEEHHNLKHFSLAN